MLIQKGEFRALGLHREPIKGYRESKVKIALKGIVNERYREQIILISPADFAIDLRASCFDARCGLA